MHSKAKMWSVIVVRCVWGPHSCMRLRRPPGDCHTARSTSDTSSAACRRTDRTRLYISRTLPHNITVLHQTMLWTRVSWRRRCNLPQYWEQRVGITESWQIMLQDTHSRSSLSMNWPSGQLCAIAQALTNTCTAHAHTFFISNETQWTKSE